MKRKEEREKIKQTKDSAYGKTMADLSYHIKGTMENEKQGFVFSTIPPEEDKRPSFSSLGLVDKDFTGFWVAIATLIRTARFSIPEDDVEDLKEGFLPMVEMVIDECFPSIKVMSTFDDREEEEEE